MRYRLVPALAALLAAGLAGCGSGEISSSVTGSYARDEAAAGGASTRLRLNVTATGMSVTNASGSAAPAAVKLGSALFKSVKCADESSCRFTTESGCEGTFTREAAALVVIATGECESWSGKWGPDQGGAPPAPSTSASTSAIPSADPAAPATVPSGAQAPTPTTTALPSGAPSSTATASGAPSASGAPTSLPTTFPTAFPTGTAINVTCLAKCQETNMACVRECKVGELDCMKGCSDKMVTCAKACP